MQGLIEASHDAESSGLATFAVYHCTATHSGSGGIDIALVRLIGGSEKHVYTIPASRQVHLAADPDSNTLVIVESECLRLSLRPPAPAVVEWFAALSNNTPDGSNGVFSPPVRQHKPSAARSWSQSTTSSDDEQPGNVFLLHRTTSNSVKLSGVRQTRPMRVRSLDEVLRSVSSSSSIAGQSGLRYKTSSEPEIFAEASWNQQGGYYEANMSQAPSYDDMASVFELQCTSSLSVIAL